MCKGKEGPVSGEFDAGIGERVKAILTPDESIEHMVMQQGYAGLRLDAVILTNKRFILYHPGLLSVSFEDYLWRDLDDVHLAEGFLGATLTFTVKDKKMSVDKLPKADARKLYAIAQQREQEAAEVRRQRQMQEDSARAGHIVVGGVAAGPASAPLADDPMAKLTKLKNMLDAGLITQEEYDRKKADILAAL